MNLRKMILKNLRLRMKRIRLVMDLVIRRCKNLLMIIILEKSI